MAAKALIVDFGGVLTTSIWPAFAQFCEAEGLEAEAVRDLFRGDAEALRLLRALETGEIDSAEFEPAFGALLGVDDSTDLTARLFAGLQPDEAMIAAVGPRAPPGSRPGLSPTRGASASTSARPIDIFDEAIISGDVGLHKPQPEIYLMACGRLGIEPAEAVFVDDLRENCEGAEAVGMTALLHRESEETVPKLEELLGVGLRASA